MPAAPQTAPSAPLRPGISGLARGAPKPARQEGHYLFAERVAHAGRARPCAQSEVIDVILEDGAIVDWRLRNAQAGTAHGGLACWLRSLRNFPAAPGARRAVLTVEPRWSGRRVREFRLVGPGWTRA